MRQQLDGTFAGRLPRPLRKLIGAGEEMHNSLAKGITASNLVLAMFDWLSATNSYVGLFFAELQQPAYGKASRGSGEVSVPAALVDSALTNG